MRNDLFTLKGNYLGIGNVCVGHLRYLYFFIVEFLVVLFLGTKSLQFPCKLLYSEENTTWIKSVKIILIDKLYKPESYSLHVDF